MASNEIPKSCDPLVALGQDAVDGAHTHGAAIGLKQNTEAAIQADLAALRGAQQLFSQRGTAKSKANAGHRMADSNAKAFIGLFIQLEAPRLGGYGPLWEEAGFSGGSISVPGTMDDRYALLGKLHQFLKTHPAYEVKDAQRPELDVTAALAETVYGALTGARKGVKDANTENGTALADRDAALGTLRQRLIGLREELDQLIPDDSPLWYAFGFNRPADPNTPGQPAQLVLTAGAAGSGIVIADWDGARRATSYRLRVEVAGEPKPREAARVQDTQTTLGDLPLGKMLTVTVTAHNDAGDGAASDPAKITLA